MPSSYDNYRQNNAFAHQSQSYQSYSGPPAAVPAFPPDNRSFHPVPVAQQKVQRVPPMPKAQVLELVEKCKRGIVVVSLVGFATLSALVLSNMHVSASQTTSPQTNPASSSASDSSDSSAGSIFQQQQGGYGFGSDPSSQQPVSRSQRS